MGQAMCGHILEAGFSLTVFNRTPRWYVCLHEVWDLNWKIFTSVFSCKSNAYSHGHSWHVFMCGKTVKQRLCVRKELSWSTLQLLLLARVTLFLQLLGEFVFLYWNCRLFLLTWHTSPLHIQEACAIFNRSLTWVCQLHLPDRDFCFSYISSWT